MDKKVEKIVRKIDEEFKKRGMEASKEVNYFKIKKSQKQ